MDLKLFIQANWDRALGWGCLALGCLAIWLGWLGVSGTALSFEQLPYLVSGGIFGIALIGVGSTLLLSADLRDEWRKLERLEVALERFGELAAPAGGAPPSASAPAAPVAKADDTTVLPTVPTVSQAADGHLAPSQAGAHAHGQ